MTGKGESVWQKELDGRLANGSLLWMFWESGVLGCWGVSKVHCKRGGKNEGEKDWEVRD